MTARLVRTSVVVLGLSVFLIFLWFFLETALASAKGFETTDEALYLLVSRELGGAAQWGFPAGWHTSPFYLLSGQSVANFRTLGAMTLGLIGMFLGIASFLVTSDLKNVKEIITRRKLFPVTVFAAIGLSGSLFYYASLLRAPSYNWTNLVGLLIASIGFLLILWKTNGDTSPETKRAYILFSALVGFGLFFSFPGKPSSPFLFFALAVPLLILFLGWRRGLMLCTQIAASGILMIPLAVLVGLWPRNFYSVFSTAVTAPPLTDSRSVGGALMELGSFPYALGMALLTDNFSTGLSLTALVLGILAFLVPRKRKWLSIILVLVGGVLVVWHFALDDLIAHGTVNTSSWARVETGLSLIILYLLSVALFFLTSRFASKDGEARSRRAKILHGSLVLGWVSVIFGFGSSNPLMGMASHAGVALLLGSTMFFTAAIPAQSRFVSKWPMAIVSIGLATLIISDSHARPYRLSPMAEQTSRLELHDAGRSVLYVDSETAEHYEAIFLALEKNGFTAGTPLLGLEWTWNAALPYASGASVLPSAMPTLFGYPGSLDRLDFNLTQGCPTFDCERAWVAITDPNSLEDQSANVIEAAHLRLWKDADTQSLWTRVLIFQGNDLSIYKPKN